MESKSSNDLQPFAFAKKSKIILQQPEMEEGIN